MKTFFNPLREECKKTVSRVKLSPISISKTPSRILLTSISDLSCLSSRLVRRMTIDSSCRVNVCRIDRVDSSRSYIDDRCTESKRRIEAITPFAAPSWRCQIHRGENSMVFWSVARVSRLSYHLV